MIVYLKIHSINHIVNGEKERWEFQDNSFFFPIEIDLESSVNILSNELWWPIILHRSFFSHHLHRQVQMHRTLLIRSFDHRLFSINNPQILLQYHSKVSLSNPIVKVFNKHLHQQRMSMLNPLFFNKYECRLELIVVCQSIIFRMIMLNLIKRINVLLLIQLI